MPSLVCLPWLAAAALCNAADGIDVAEAARCFREAREIAQRDAGHLWGVALDGPMIFADSGSNAVVANQADREGKLKSQGEVFVGSLPPDFPTANTATRWAGVEWTMVKWPLPTSTRERARLMLHELFHRVQPALGLQTPEAPNRHLDRSEGRLLLQLEWRALSVALGQSGDAQRAAIEDALVFRARREQIFPSARAEERALR